MCIRDRPIRTELIRSVVDAGFRALDAGHQLDDATHWALVGVDAIIEASEGRGDRPRS